VERTGGSITASIKPEAVTEKRLETREDAVQAVLDQAGPGARKKDVLVDASGEGFSARLKPSARERLNKQRREDAVMSLAESSDEFTESDVDVRETDDGFEAFITDEAMEREKQEARRDLLQEAGDDYSLSDITIDDSGDGFRPMIKESALERERQEARQEARESLLGKAGDEFTSSDVAVEQTDEGFTARLTEAAIERERDEARQEASEEVTSDLLSRAGDRYTEDDVSVSFGDGGVTASLEESAVEREKQEVTSEWIQRADEATPGVDIGRGDVTFDDRGLPTGLNNQARRKLTAANKESAVNNLLDQTGGRYSRSDVYTEETEDGVQARVKKSAAKRELRDDVVSQDDNIRRSDVVIKESDDGYYAEIKNSAKERLARQNLLEQDDSLSKSDVEVSEFNGQYRAKVKESVIKERAASQDENYSASDLVIEDGEISLTDAAAEREQAEVESDLLALGAGAPRRAYDQRSREALRNIDRSLEEQTGEDLTPGEDYRLSRNEEGEIVAEFQPGATEESREAIQQGADELEEGIATQLVIAEGVVNRGNRALFEGAVESRAESLDLQRGEDFTLRETDDGYEYQLTEETKGELNRQMQAGSIEKSLREDGVIVSLDAEDVKQDGDKVTVTDEVRQEVMNQQQTDYELPGDGPVQNFVEDEYLDPAAGIVNKIAAGAEQVNYGLNAEEFETVKDAVASGGFLTEEQEEPLENLMAEGGAIAEEVADRRTEQAQSRLESIETAIGYEAPQAVENVYTKGWAGGTSRAAAGAASGIAATILGAETAVEISEDTGAVETAQLLSGGAGEIGKAAGKEIKRDPYTFAGEVVTGAAVGSAGSVVARKAATSAAKTSTGSAIAKATQKVPRPGIEKMDVGGSSGYMAGIRTADGPVKNFRPMAGVINRRLQAGTPDVDLGAGRITSDLKPGETRAVTKTLRQTDNPTEATKIEAFRDVQRQTQKSDLKPEELESVVGDVLEKHGAPRDAASDVLEMTSTDDAAIYGSITQKAAAEGLDSPGLSREARDIDIDDLSDKKEFAEEVSSKINKRANEEVVELDEGVPTSKKTGEKVFDLHEAGDESAQESGERIYGIEHETDVKVDGTRTTTLSEQGTRKGEGAMKLVSQDPRETGPLRGRVGPLHEGRVKDIADYVDATEANIEHLRWRRPVSARRARSALDEFEDAWDVGSREGADNAKVRLDSPSKSPGQSSFSGWRSASAGFSSASQAADTATDSPSWLRSSDDGPSPSRTSPDRSSPTADSPGGSISDVGPSPSRTSPDGSSPTADSPGGSISGYKSVSASFNGDAPAGVGSPSSSASTDQPEGGSSSAWFSGSPSAQRTDSPSRSVSRLDVASGSASLSFGSSESDSFVSPSETASPSPSPVQSASPYTDGFVDYSPESPSPRVRDDDRKTTPAPESAERVDFGSTDAEDGPYANVGWIDETVGGLVGVDVSGAVAGATTEEVAESDWALEAVLEEDELERVSGWSL